MDQFQQDIGSGIGGLQGRLKEYSSKPVLDSERPSRCAGCPYPQKRTCGGRGSVDAPIVVIAESPGIQEERCGYPLVGPSGVMWESVLPREFRNEESILYLNSVQCFPGLSGEKNQNVLLNATFSCRARLMEEILAHPREVILSLGKYSSISLLGAPKVQITKIRGTQEQLKYNNKPLAKNGVHFIVHPSYILRGGGNIQVFKKDVLRALSYSSIGKGEEKGRKGEKEEKGEIASDGKINPPVIIQHRRLEHLFQALGDEKATLVAADIETTGFSHLKDQILYLGMYSGGPYCHVISGANLFLGEGESSISVPPELRFIWQNGKFDVKFLHEVGVHLGVDEDTMLMSYTLNEQSGNHDLDAIALHYCDLQPHKSMVDKYLVGKKNKSYAQIPKGVLLEYLSRDLRSTLWAYKAMRLLVEEDKHNSLLYSRLLRASSALVVVEEEGMHIDLDAINKNDAVLKIEREGIRENILRITGGEVENPSSIPQVQRYIYETLKYPRISTSTNVEVLEKLRSMRPSEFIDALLEYRKKVKLHGTYVKGMWNHIIDGRVRSTYLLHGTITGRLASRNPNMQNIPRGPFIRNQFNATSGKLLMGIDLNQAELRALACISGDKELCRVYNDGRESLHDLVARLLFGGSGSSSSSSSFTPTREQRIRAKAVNFGIIYGRSAADIAKEFSLSKQEGERWLRWWFDQFPEAHRFLLECRRSVELGKTIISPFGNKKRPKVITRQTRNNAENQAANFLPQNIGSNLILDAVSNLILRDTAEAGEKWERRKVVNLIHDEVLYELDSDEDEGGGGGGGRELMKSTFEEFAQEVDAIAHQRGLTKVRFICEAKMGTRWGDLQETGWVASYHV